MVANSLRETKNIRITSVLFTFLLGFAFSRLIVLNFKIAILFIWLSLWILALIIFLIKFIGKKDINVLLPFIVGGLIIRLVVAFLFRIKAASTGGLITPDEFFYFNYAIDIADAWKSGNFMGLSDIQHYVGTRNFGYHIYDALHFLILKEKLMPVISNVFLDVISSLILYKFASEFFGKRRGKLAFLLYLFNPYLIYWSTFNLKDTLISFLLVVFLFAVYNGYIITVILSLILLLTLRFYLPFLMIIVLVITLLSKKEHTITIKITIGTAILTLMIVFYHYPPLRDTIDTIRMQGLWQIAHFYTTRSLEIAQSKEYSTNLITGYDPKSLGISVSHFFLSPSPFNIKGDGKYLLWGTIFWYFLFPYYIVGTIIFLKMKKLRLNYIFLWLFPLCIVLLIISFLPAINEPRHRLMIMPFATVLASIGLTYKYRYKKVIIFIAWIYILTAIFGREFLLGHF